MTYKINKTDGSVLAEVIDSAIDQTTTDITLIGKNVSGYGEYLNENFVKILENFANTSEPNNPITGQIWFDTAENRLKVYDGNGFKIGSGPIVTGTQPTNLVQGDLWINSVENQLYFYDGVDLQLAGPIYKDSQGISGFIVESIFDSNQTQRTIMKLWVAQSLLGIFSKEIVPFTPRDPIAGFSGQILPGFNQSTLSGMKFNVTSSAADTLIDPLGVALTTENFMRTDKNTNTVGSIYVFNSTPFVLGPSSNTEIKVDGSATQFISNTSGQDYLFKVKNSLGTVDALTIKSISQRVGIFNIDPTTTLDVNGDMRVVGNLTVEGTTTNINTTNIDITDKNITIANVTSPTDASADGAGITIKGTTDKTIIWADATDTFDLSEHVNLASGKAYYINGTQILSSTALSSSVTSAPGLTGIGTLSTLTVDNLNINNNRITAIDTNGSVELSPNGTGTISVIGSARISGLGDPVNAQDATTKTWTESYVKARVIPISLDTTGLNDADIALVLGDIAPADIFANGTEARVHCTKQVVTYPTVSLTTSTSPTVTGNFVKYVTTVDKAGGSENQSVLTDFTINSINLGTATLSVTRILKLYRIVTGSWTWIQDLVSSV